MPPVYLVGSVLFNPANGYTQAWYMLNTTYPEDWFWKCSTMSGKSQRLMDGLLMSGLLWTVEASMSP